MFTCPRSHRTMIPCLSCLLLVKCYIMPATLHLPIFMMLLKDCLVILFGLSLTHNVQIHAHTAITWYSLVLEQGSECLTTRRRSQEVLIKTGVFYPLWEAILWLRRRSDLSIIWETGTGMRLGQQKQLLVSKTHYLLCYKTNITQMSDPASILHSC